MNAPTGKYIRQTNSITFKTTDDGRVWTMAAFCAHYKVSPNSVRHRYYRLDRPTEVETHEILPDSNRHGGQNAKSIIIIMPDGSRKTCSIREMGEVCNEYEGTDIATVSHRARWIGMGRPGIIKLAELIKRKAAGRSKMDLSHIPDGDLACLSGRMTEEKNQRLNSIPGPSRYEKKHFNSAGQFGAGTVQRSNWAGTNSQGFPIYTGRM